MKSTVLTIISGGGLLPYIQWLKCNITQEGAVPPPPIYGSKRHHTSACYNARKRHATTAGVTEGEGARSWAYLKVIYIFYKSFIYQKLVAHKQHKKT